MIIKNEMITIAKTRTQLDLKWMYSIILWSSYYSSENSFVQCGQIMIKNCNKKFSNSFLFSALQQIFVYFWETVNNFLIQ